MEIAGLAVGTLALVGVFEDCVRLFSQIGAAKSMEKDYTLLATRLDVQKALLLQWAERMNIYDEKHCDPRLRDPIIGSLIYRALDCIRKLLKDGDFLQERYGVRRALAAEESEPSTAASHGLMLRLRNNSLALRLRRDATAGPPDRSKSLHHPSSGNRGAKRPRADIESLLPHEEALHQQRPKKKPDQKQLQPTQTSVNNRKGKPFNLDTIQWVIKDKEKFDNLVRELSAMIADIDRLVPFQGGDDSKHTILGHDFQALSSIRELRKIMHASVTDNNDLISITKQAIDKACSELILNRLWFRLIDDREHNIADAHSETLGWSIQPPTLQVAWDDLSQWFRSGRDIYWIHGKPGSGKSTLMKFLYHRPAVMSWLQEWAGDRKLTVASFFLWNIGTTEQSSQEGLARGLLYHVLKQNPKLIPTVLPYMWQEAQNGCVDLSTPSDSGMKTAFQRVGEESTTGAFAFFIDGLDEFTGNHRDGISFVKSLTTSANIKVLVSSRPIDMCVAAFSSAPQLRLQDLTKLDIEIYVKDAIHSHPCVADSNYLSDTTIQGLIKNIRSKASGVFLWVVLACRTLIEGFDAYDDAEELQCRVNELPPELEDLFRHILSGLPVRFRQQCAKLLRVCYIRSALLGSVIPTSVLAWAHENDMSIPRLDQFDPVSLADQDRKCTILEGRLRSRCRGLLEVHRDPNTEIRSTVDFMHRTVFEFLSTVDVWKMDCLHIADDLFEDTTMLAYMSCYDLYLRTEPILKGRIVSEIYHCLQNVACRSPSNLSRVVNRAAFALMQQRDGCQLFGLHDALTLGDVSLLLAVEFSLASFVEEYRVREFNDKQRLCIDDQSKRYNLLYHALGRPLFYGLVGPKDIGPCSPAIVDLLLRSGCDPDQQIGARDMLRAALRMTPWRTWMQSDHGISLNETDGVSPMEFSQVAESTVLMIRAGAGVFDQEHVEKTARRWLSKAEWDSEDIGVQKYLRAHAYEMILAVRTYNNPTNVRPWAILGPSGPTKPGNPSI